MSENKFKSMSSKLCAPLAVLALLAGGVGCQSDHMAASGHGAAKQAVVAWSAHGGPAAVFMQDPDTGKSTVLASGSSVKECGGCRTAANEYFRTGTLPPKCPVCGANLTAVAAD